MEYRNVTIIPIRRPEIPMGTVDLAVDLLRPPHTPMYFVGAARRFLILQVLSGEGELDAATHSVLA